MKISSKFTVAVHTLLCIYRLKKEYKVTSDFIAGSTGVNPVIIRRTLISLKA
ncbi:Rrf2 family transcriptional regulator, partial [Treponema succinifaciens]|uniref:Rrf2 family transcriptional regulator n=1 Tax=Treponema succinifaciens TaxID=167 RepID=UPI003FCCD1F6